LEGSWFAMDCSLLSDLLQKVSKWNGHGFQNLPTPLFAKEG